MWKVYLDMKEYTAALANCRDSLQRDQVYLAQVLGSWLVGIVKVIYLLFFNSSFLQ